MNGKNRFGIIATAVVLMVCLVIVTGSTFSLFTSDDGKDIVVNAAKVELAATIDETTLILYSKDAVQDRIENGYRLFENGGTAGFTDDGKTLVFDNIAPGDKAEFKIKVANSSTIDIMYRIKWTYTGDLGEHLNAVVDGADITSGTSEWTKWTPDDENTKNLSLVISLPLNPNMSDDYQGETAKISFYIEAVQANGTGEYSPKAFVNTESGLQAAIDSGATEITLNDSIDLTETLNIGKAANENTRRSARRANNEESNTIVIDLNGHTLNSKVTDGAAIVNNADLKLVNGNITTVSGVAFENNATAEITTVTIDGAVSSNGTNSKLTLDDSNITVSGEIPAISATEGGAVVVKDGTYTNTSEDGAVISGNVTVEDGSFDGKVEAGEGDNNAPTIGGGNFSEAPETGAIPEGYRYACYNGSYILVPNAKGSVTPAYTSTNDFWGEAGGNAYESFVISIYEGETVIATASLNNIDGIIDGDVYVTWHAPFAGSNDPYWNVEWAENYPNVDMAPTKVTITIDGVEVGENNQRWNGPDDINKIVAISEDANGVKCYTNFADVANAAAGAKIKLLRDVTLNGELTLPTGTTLNANGKVINGNIKADGDLTLKGDVKVTQLNFTGNAGIITIGEDASLEVKGTSRQVIGHGYTFNITGNVENAKTADTANLKPSLILPGISFTGKGLTFNLTNAYVKIYSQYSSSSKSASGLHKFDIENSIWEEYGKFAYEAQSTATTLEFDFKDSVLKTGSHVIFGTNGDVVIDNSIINEGAAKQFENRGNMTIKNGSVVYASVATSSNAKQPGTLIVDNSQFIGSGEFTGSDLGTGTLVVQNNAYFKVGSFGKVNVTVDTTCELVGTFKDGSTLTTLKVVDTASAADEALLNGETVILGSDLTFNVSETAASSGYGANGLCIDKGAVLDGNGKVIIVNGANGTWDCAIIAKNGTIKNVTVSGGFRGIFMGGASGDVYIDNVVIDNVCYTFNSDDGSKDYGVYISNSTINGWTSFSNVHKEVVFTNCTFGQGTGAYDYAFCRPYNATVFENCVFEEGYEFDTSNVEGLVFIGCYYGETLITAENAATLGLGDATFFYNGLNGAVIK